MIKVKEECEKAGLKFSIQKTKIMASSPITSQQLEGETMETVTISGGAPKPLQMVTAAIKLIVLGTSPGSKVVKTLCFYCRELEFNLWLGN